MMPGVKSCQGLPVCWAVQPLMAAGDQEPWTPWPLPAPQVMFPVVAGTEGTHPQISWGSFLQTFINCLRLKHYTAFCRQLYFLLEFQKH